MARWTTALVAVAALGAACGGGDAGSPAPSPPAPTSSATPAAGPSDVAGPDLTRLADEAVVAPAEGESYTNPGAVVEVDGTLHLLRNSFTRWPGPSVVHHLTSDDGGRTWELAGEEPVLVSEDVPYADQTAFVTSALVEPDGTWVAYLYTYDGQLNEGVIGRATAPAPEGPWAVDPEPILVPGPSEAWNGLRLAEPSVVRTDEGYRMWFVGFRSSTESAIGLATSPDGVAWTEHDGPVLTGEQDWTGGAIDSPQVVRDGEGYVLLHDSSARRTFAIGLATSPDGVAWTPHDANPLLTQEDTGEQFWQAELFHAGGELRYLLEVGPGSTTTSLYLYRLNLE